MKSDVITERLEFSTERRNLVVGTLAAATTCFSGISTSSTTAHAPSKKLGETSQTTLASVSEAVQWIDDHCDRRFLHAVVASNYRFLYRGVGAVDENFVDVISVRHEKSDLLLPNTYGSKAALSFFQRLEEVLRDEPVKPSNGHLATTSSTDAAAWGSTAASIWPSGEPTDVHYAWFQDRRLFYPRASSSLDRRSIIVDGRDCGKDSLEDALRGESMEVMFSTPTFLAVPISKEAELLEQLRHAFLV